MPWCGTVLRVRLRLGVPDDFDFRNAVCSHGFFVLAPNRWDPARQRLRTVVTLSEEEAIAVEIAERAGGGLQATSPQHVTADERQCVTRAIRRMLRLDESLADFHARCRASSSHREAADLRFGRLLRSATLFEDMVKVICTCNTGWAQTVGMIDRIVTRWGVPVPHSAERGFPTPQGLAAVSPARLKAQARVGYRGEFLHRLARDAEDGKLDLGVFEDGSVPTEDLFGQLKQIRGVGDYAAGHLCMLLGRYDRLAIDSETLRFLTERFPRRRWTPAHIRAHYAGWQPHAFLAYWFELWQDYQRRHGPSAEWPPAQVGSRITQA